MSRIKILLVGPYPPPISGQSTVFSTVVNNIQNKLVIDTNKFEFKILNFFYYIILLLIYTTKHKISLIYFTCSRSFLGSLRDVILLTLASKLKVKTINHLHGSDFKVFFNTMHSTYKKILFKCYNHVDSSIVLTKGMIDQFENFENMKKIVIPNFYPSTFDSIKIDKKNKYKILFFSNIMKSKGVFEFLNLAKKLLQNNSKIKVDIAGNIQGDNFMSYKKTSSLFFKKLNKIKTNFNGRINYHGPVYENKKLALFSESSFFVLPSYHEAFPLTILEAMKAKNVIISSKTKYIHDIITNKNGLVTNDINKMYSYINNLLEDEEELNKIQNFNSVNASKFNQKKFVSEILRVLN